MTTYTVHKAPSGPLQWQVLENGKLICRFSTKRLASGWAAIAGGDRSGAAAWYRDTLAYARRRMGETDAVRYSILSAQKLGLSPGDVGADPNGVPVP